jgi:hypothetical protein
MEMGKNEERKSPELQFTASRALDTESCYCRTIISTPFSLIVLQDKKFSCLPTQFT